MDIAIKMAERIGLRKLCDRIDEFKLRKFSPFDEEDEPPFDDDASYDSRRSDERSSGSLEEEEEEPVIATRQQRMEMMSQRISPEGVRTPRRQTEQSHGDESDGDQSTEEESPPRQTLKRKLTKDLPAPASKKRINPFAKKKLESPAKGIMKTAGASPSKLSLSRNSTFSTKSRQKQRSGKQIV